MTFYTPKIIPSQDRENPGLLAEHAPSAVVIRATNWLGDNLMSMPAIHRLRQALPESCTLHVVCKQSLVPLWEATDWIDSVLGFDGKRLFDRDKEKVRELHADAALILPNSFGSALDMFNCSIPIRVGRSGRGRSLLLTHRLPRWRSEWKQAEFHQVTHYFELVDSLMPVKREMPECPLLSVEENHDTLDRLGLGTYGGTGKPLAMAPGAAYGPAKQWPIEDFATTAQDWTMDGGCVVVVGTRKEWELGETIRKTAPENVVNLCGKTSLPELMTVLNRCCACVCNDSGVMHLAAALGTPGVAMFGSTNPAATGPLGEGWIVMSNATHCPPCFRRTCRTQVPNDYMCLRSITPDAVTQALRQILTLESARHPGADSHAPLVRGPLP